MLHTGWNADKVTVGLGSTKMFALPDTVPLQYVPDMLTGVYPVVEVGLTAMKVGLELVVMVCWVVPSV